MNANWLKATGIVLACLAVSASEATEYRWVGGSTAEWNVSANWDPAGTPTGGDTAVFTNATTVTDDIVLGEGMLVLTNTASAVHLKGVISGAGGIDKGGGGALHLYGNNTFAGKLISTGTGKTYAGYGVTSEIDHGSSEIIVYHPHAFGNAGVECDQTTPKTEGLGARITFRCTGEVTVPVKTSGDYNSSSGTLAFESATGTVTFAETVSSRFRQRLYIRSTALVTVRFLKKEMRTNYLTMHFSRNDQRVYFYGEESGSIQPSGADLAEVHLMAKSTSSFNLFMQDARIVCGCTDALAPTLSYLKFNKASSIIDLGGFDQYVGSVALENYYQNPSTTAFGFISTNATPAQIRFGGGIASLHFHGTFYGNAGLEWNPTNDREFVYSNAVSATTGEIEVKRHRVRLTAGAGFTGLSTLAVSNGATFMVDSPACQAFARRLVLESGAKLSIAAGATVDCSAATADGNPLPAGEYDKTSESVTIVGDGKLVVGGPVSNAWIGTSGDWSDGMKWQRGLPQPGDTAVLGNGANVSLAATPIGLAGLKIDDGAQLAVTGWDTCVTAGVVTVEGTLTTPAALDAGDASGANNPASRLWVRCASLTVGATGRIDVDAKGWMAGYAAPGSPKKGAGASHGGYGSITCVSTELGAIYDDPMSPTYPGSGYYTTDGTAGGGAVRIEAAGAVTVNGKLLASGGNVPVNASSCSWKYAGSGGSIWISCATFAGNGGEVRADGGNGDWGMYPDWIWRYREGRSANGGSARAGGGGMIRIEYGSGQSGVTLTDMVVSAAGGLHVGSADGVGRLTVANEDKYRTEADLGTLTFTDDTLVRQLLGKGLSGRLYGVSSFTHTGDLNWTSGHIRFPGDAEHGVDVKVTGSLTLNGSGSRLEIGGYMTGTNRSVFVDRYAGTHQNRLEVGGDLQLLSGSALDIRAAETNAWGTWGGVVKTAGDLTVGEGSYLYPWCDVKNLGAPKFEVGGDFTVAAGGTVMADRRGGMGGRGGSNWKSYFDPKRPDSSEKGFGYGRGSTAAASHGGVGGQYVTLINGCEYGAWGVVGVSPADEWTAAFPGAGGGASGYGEGGEGGGLVCVEAQGAVTVNGTISANGWLGYYTSLGNGTGTIYPTFGSGSGGGICLSGSTFTGAGTISARGGDAISGTVKGTGASAGLTYTYASACGGGGRVAIATGADKAASGRKVKTTRALVPPQPAVCAVTFDMGGGTNIWNDVGYKTAPIQVEKSLGTVGTVRYVDTDFTPGMILFLR